MFTATIFKEFISITDQIGVIDVAQTISDKPDWKKYGMDGHDVGEFLQGVLPKELLDQVELDPESGAFFCYYKLETPEQVKYDDVRKAREWMDKATKHILDVFRDHARKIQEKNKPQLNYTEEAEDSLFVKIVNFDIQPISMTLGEFRIQHEEAFESLVQEWELLSRISREEAMADLLYNQTYIIEKEVETFRFKTMEDYLTYDPQLKTWE